MYAAYATETPEEKGALQVKQREPLTIVTERGAHRFHVEFVNTPEDMRTGLMFRETLDKDTGMLFDFVTPRRISMWMKNTMIPLDMLFISASGTIVDIAENTTPFSTEIITSDRPAQAVLEVPAGTCNHYGIAPGDTVQHPLFSTAR